MAQLSRRLFLLLGSALLPGLLKHSADAVTTKKPSPTPTKKKTTPTPTPKKPTPAPTTKKPTSSTSASSSPSKGLEGVVIAKSSDLVLRQSKIFFLKDSFGISSGYALTRTSRGVVAFDIRCTHAGAPTFLSGGKLQCPAHGSIFDPETGQVVRMPAVEPLKSYRTIEANGEIRIITS
mgnify:CR=1 FL=1